MYYFLMRLFYEFNENIFQKARHKKNWLISSFIDEMIQKINWKYTLEYDYEFRY